MSSALTAEHHSHSRQATKNSTKKEDSQNQKDALLAVKPEKTAETTTEAIIHQDINIFYLNN
jgi:hypothetical protein